MIKIAIDSHLVYLAVLKDYVLNNDKNEIINKKKMLKDISISDFVFLFRSLLLLFFSLIVNFIMYLFEFIQNQMTSIVVFLNNSRDNILFFYWSKTQTVL